MSTVRVRQGDTERIQTPAVKDGSLAAITGSATIVLAIQRTSDGFWLDFNDSTFKAAGWTTRQQAMTEVSATLAPGEYRYDWTTPASAETYMLRIDDTSATAANTPFVGEIKVDPWASPGDAMDLVANAVDAAAIATDAIDADAIAAGAIGTSEAPLLANLDATVSSRESELSAAARAVTNTAEHAATLAAVGLVETEAAAATREATNTAEHAATLAAVNALAFATPADIAALQAALEAYGDLNWATAVGFATSAELAALEAHGDLTWATAVGFETEAAAAVREATNTAEHAATLAAVGALAFATPADIAALEAHGDLAWATATGFETEASAAIREATNTAEHAATLAAVGLVPTVGEIDAELTANHGAGSWQVGSLSPTEATHLAEVWTVLGLNPAAPASFDSAALFVQALAAGIDIAISVVGTTVTLTRAP